MCIFRLRLGHAVALLVLAAAAPLTAQTPPQAAPPKPPSIPKAASASPVTTNLPPARDIIERHLKAIGGKAAVLAKSSSRASGTITVPSAGISGSLEVFAAKPNKTLIRIDLAGVGEVQEGFDGTNGWSISAMTGPTLLDGKALEQRRFDSDFYAEVKAPERYSSITTVERGDFEGRQCYKLRLVRTGGDEEFEFYDVETGLKAGAISTRETPMGPVSGTMVETDYRKFGDLLVATMIRQTVMGLQQVMSLTTVEYDTVDPAVFQPPASIKALIK